MLEYKSQILAVAPPVFLVGFWLFARFVLLRLPLERQFEWKIFSFGAYSAIAGLAVAVYVNSVEIGATVVLIGAILGAIGLGKLLSR